MPNNTTMILFLNADQQEALHDLQCALMELYDSHGKPEVSQDAMRAMICDASVLYARVMRPTYEPEKN